MAVANDPDAASSRRPASAPRARGTHIRQGMRRSGLTEPIVACAGQRAALLPLRQRMPSSLPSAMVGSVQPPVLVPAAERTAGRRGPSPMRPGAGSSPRPPASARPVRSEVPWTCCGTLGARRSEEILRATGSGPSRRSWDQTWCELWATRGRGAAEEGSAATVVAGRSRSRRCQDVS
jgi:hypothetical protein